jgi:hypothetical protein
MRDHTEITSNVTALAVISCLAALWLLIPPPPRGGAAPVGGNDVELSLEAAPEPAPPPPPVAEASPPPPPPPEPKPPEPPPVEPPPPIPPPPPVEEPPKPDEEPPKPMEMLKDEEGEKEPTPPPLPVLPELSEVSRLAITKCLEKVVVYPSSKEARRLKPHGTVVIAMSIVDRVIVAAEVTTSSGSQILDQAAKSTVMKSGCGSQSEPGSFTGPFRVNY